MATVGTLAVNVIANTTPFVKGMQRSRQQVKGLRGAVSSSLGSLANYAKGMAAAAAAGISLTAVLGQVRSAFSDIDETTKVARSLDLTTEALVGFQHAAGLTSTLTQGGLNKALKDFNRRIAEAREGTGEGAKAFESLGLSAEKVGKMGVENAFFAVADAIKAIDDPGKKALATYRLFGRSGVDLVNTLNEGSDALRRYAVDAKELGKTFSPEEGKKIEAANDAISRLSDAWSGLFRELAIFVAPTLVKLADYLSEAVKQVNKLADAVTSFDNQMRESQGFGLLDVLTFATGITTVQDISSALGFTDAIEKAPAVRKGLIDTSAAIDLVDASADSAAGALEQVDTVLEGLKSRGESIRLSLRTPFEQLRDTVADVNHLMRVGAIDATTHARAIARAADEYQRATQERRQYESRNSAVAALERGSAAEFSARNGNSREATEARRFASEQAKRDAKRNTLLQTLIDTQKEGPRGAEKLTINQVDL